MDVPHEYLVLGVLQRAHAHCLEVGDGGPERGLVHQVEELGPREARGAARDLLQVHVRVQLHLPPQDTETNKHRQEDMRTGGNGLIAFLP